MSTATRVLLKVRTMLYLCRKAIAMQDSWSNQFVKNYKVMINLQPLDADRNLDIANDWKWFSRHYDEFQLWYRVHLKGSMPFL